MTLLHARASVARLNPWTFAALALFDGVLYLDWAMRWEHGFGFLGRSEWQLWTAANALVWLACVAWLVRDRAGFFRHFVLTFLAFSWGCFVAGTGNPTNDWRTLPFYAGLFTSSNFGVYGSEGGFDFALIAGLAHGVIGKSLAKHLRWPAPWSRERWLGALGVAFLMLGPALDQRLISRTTLGEPPLELETVRSALSSGITWFAGVLALVSAVLLVRRWFWLERVFRGEVPGHLIADAPVDRQQLATYLPLPRRWFRKVLVELEGETARAVALVPAVFGSDAPEPPRPN